jgi:hypothetical protein
MDYFVHKTIHPDYFSRTYSVPVKQMQDALSPLLRQRNAKLQRMMRDKEMPDDLRSRLQPKVHTCNTSFAYGRRRLPNERGPCNYRLFCPICWSNTLPYEFMQTLNYTLMDETFQLKHEYRTAKLVATSFTTEIPAENEQQLKQHFSCIADRYLFADGNQDRIGTILFLPVKQNIQIKFIGLDLVSSSNKMLTTHVNHTTTHEFWDLEFVQSEPHRSIIEACLWNYDFPQTVFKADPLATRLGFGQSLKCHTHYSGVFADTKDAIELPNTGCGFDQDRNSVVTDPAPLEYDEFLDDLEDDWDESTDIDSASRDE